MKRKNEYPRFHKSDFFYGNLELNNPSISFLHKISNRTLLREIVKNIIDKTEEILFTLLIIFLPSQLGKHFWPPSAFVAGIRIDYLSPAIFLSDLIIMSLFLNIIYKSRSQISLLKLKIFFNKKGTRTTLFLLLGFIAAAIFISINISASSRPSVSFYSWLRVFQLAALFFYIKKASKPLVSRFWRLLPIPVFYSSVIAIFQSVKQSSVGGLLYWIGERRFSLSTPGIAKATIKDAVMLRPYATFSHPNALAGFLLVSLILLMLIKKKSKSKRYPALFILVAITIFFTFSQTTWIVAVLITLLFWIKKRNAFKYLGSIVLLVLLILTLTSFPLESESVYDRITTAKQALRTINQSKFTGVGLGNYIPKVYEDSQGISQTLSLFNQYQPVHNFYFLIASEVGLAVASLFIMFLFLSLKKSNSDISRNLYLGLIAILATGLADHYWLTLLQNRLLFTIVLALIWRRK